MCVVKGLASLYQSFSAAPRCPGIRSICTTHRRWMRSYREASQDINDVPEYAYVGERIKTSLRVYVWGNTTHGGLGVAKLLRPNKPGLRPYASMPRPYRLPFTEMFEVCDVACGYGFTLFAVKNKGGPSCFGTGMASDCQIGLHSPRKGHSLAFLIQPVPIGLPVADSSKITQVACGRAHSIILSQNEGVWSVGNNSYGQCGRPIVSDEDYSCHATFHRLTDINGRAVEQVECGQDTSFILSEGRIFSCGWGADGQTGQRTPDSVSKMAPVEGDLNGEHIVKLSSRADCALALNDKGEVFGWGNSEYRQLCSVTDEQQVYEPRHLNLKGFGNIVDIGASGTACFFVTDSGELFSWGYGILGRGPSEEFCSKPEPIPSTLLGRTVLSPESKVTRVFCGATMAMALNSDGILYSWGRNSYGCLGLGHANHQPFPMRVNIAGRVLKVSCGVDHVAAVVRSLM